MIADGLIAGFYASGGQQIGIALNGYLYIPSSQGGIVMQDASGALWLLTIDTSGRLNTLQVVL